MATENVIGVDANSVVSTNSQRKAAIEVIDLLSSDEEDNNAEETGGVTVASILREYYPEMMASQSEEHPSQYGRDSKRISSQDKNYAMHQADNADPNNDPNPNPDPDLLDNNVEDRTESFDYDKPRSLEFLRDHCWACHVWVHHPGFDRDGTNDEICFNALHLHPTLGVPVCVICAETIETVESKLMSEGIVTNDNQVQSVEDESEDNSTACNSCGRSKNNDEDFVRCDMCPRAFCSNCFEQANHFTDSDEKKFLSSSRKRPRPKSVQRCFCCSSSLKTDGAVDEVNTSSDNTKAIKSNDQSHHDLPPFLQKLQNLTLKLFSSSDGETKQSIEDMIDELNTLEIEKRSCESHLDDPKYLLDKIKEEINEEIEALGGIVEEEILKIRVHERYQHRYEEWTHHQTRLMDRITLLCDRLKAEYRIEAAAAFRYIEANNNAGETDEYGTRETGNEEEEPLYKVAADYELSKRDKDERLKRRKEDKRAAQKCNSDPKYLLEITEDAEDLGSSDEVDRASDGDVSDDDKTDAYDNGWRNAPFRARQEDIDAVMIAEDMHRLKERKLVSIHRNKNHDMKEMKNWHSGLTASAMIVKKKSKKRKRISTRIMSMRSGKSPSTARTPAIVRKPQQREREKISSGNRIVAPFGEPIADTNINMIVGRPKGLERSKFVLSTDPFICVPGEFDKHLKEHQKDGIEFMYKSTFADLGKDKEAKIGGCILAHSMGLGKSLSCVSLLYTMMTQPSLYDSERGRGEIHKALLVVPVNTIANWDNEFEKWTEGMNKRNKLMVFNVSKAPKNKRQALVNTWSSIGGILLTSTALFRSMIERDDTGKLLRATDVIILDESHTMLKNKGKTYNAFMQIKTSRRICLTGTPFQNNLLEYYRMISFIRPNLLGKSEKKFQKDFISPIQSGMASDAADPQKNLADDCLTNFVDIVGPFIHRRDVSLLRKDLPSLQQVCLHVPPTKIQRAFYGAFREHQERTSEKNFLKHYSALRTIHNHPGTLLFRNENPKEPESKKHSAIVDPPPEFVFTEFPTVKAEPTDSGRLKENSSTQKPQDDDCIIEILSSDEEEDETDENYEPNKKWWTKVAKKVGLEKMKHIESGNKCIILLHILAHASMLGEKTVVFSQSLKTLDFLSEVLASTDWQLLCPSLKESFPDQSIGGWILGKDFLRIDGGTSGTERGELLKDFSDDINLKLFLISSVAGGIGTNLVSASRVILFDSHFNPTIDLQAIYRCYRYGQTRNVFSYRLLTQGTMEEKVYSRAMNKTSLGNRVIDGKTLHRCFDQDEIDALSKFDDWVECTRCKKWRMFDSDQNEDVTNLPDDWYCKLMNKHDARMEWKCSFEEKDSEWYYQHFKKPNQKIVGNAPLDTINTKSSNKLSTEEMEKLVEKDEVLKNILAVRSSQDNSSLIVSKYYFHGTPFTDTVPANRNENVANDEVFYDATEFETENHDLTF